MTREEYEKFHEPWHKITCQNCGIKFWTSEIRQNLCDDCLDEAKKEEAEKEENEETSSDNSLQPFTVCCGLCKSFGEGMGGSLNSVQSGCSVHKTTVWSHQSCGSFELNETCAALFGIKE